MVKIQTKRQRYIWKYFNRTVSNTQDAQTQQGQVTYRLLTTQKRIEFTSVSSLIALAERGLHLLHRTAKRSGKNIQSRFPWNEYTRIISRI